MQAANTLILNGQNQTLNSNAPVQTVEIEAKKSEAQNLFDQFKKELKYTRNLSERTIHCYEDAFGKWQKHVGEIPTEMNLSRFVIGMREAGLQPTSCNIYIQSLNSFLTWLKEDGHCPQTFSNGKPFKLAKLAEEKMPAEHLCPYR